MGLISIEDCFPTDPACFCDPGDPYGGCCDPLDPSCAGPQPPGGGGAPPIPPSGPGQPPSPPPGAPPYNLTSGNSNFTSGMPDGIPTQPFNLGDLIGLIPGTECDFEECNPIGTGFSAGTIAIGAAHGGLTAGEIIALRLLGIFSLLVIEQGDGPARIPDQECVLTGEAREGNVKQCWYSCPKPGGARSNQMEMGNKWKLPSIYKMSGLNAAVKKMDDIDRNLDASNPLGWTDRKGAMNLSDTAESAGDKRI